MNNNYPTIGKRVDFLRADKDQNLHEGRGFVRAVFLDGNNRLMVQVKCDDEDQNVWNIDLAAINPCAGFKRDFAVMIETVKAITEEGNNLIKETTGTYNDKVQAEYSKVLGDPLEM